MAVRSFRNQYRGINAHLHSEFQARGGWGLLHNPHITHLMERLNKQLYPHGYLVHQEESIQIRRVDMSDGRPESDILILDRQPQRARLDPLALTPVPGERTLTLADEFIAAPLAEHTYTAIAIYGAKPHYTDAAPVAWIELLSPSNKPGGSDFKQYLAKRQQLVDAELVIVELDYLNESRSTLRDSEMSLSDAYYPPYRVVVIDPRLGVTAPGSLRRHDFAVDEPIPATQVALSGSDVFTLDWQTAYDMTLENTFLAHERVDYSVLPVNFERYSRADQARIGARMLTVCAAAKRGDDLEQAAPQPSDPALAETLYAQPDVAGAVRERIAGGDRGQD